MTCRPAGRFQVLRSFGHTLPTYSTAIGTLVDYLRHERFRRTIFWKMQQKTNGLKLQQKAYSSDVCLTHITV